MNRLMKWTALVAAVFTALILVACAFSPNARLIALMSVGYLFNNKSPPLIADGIALQDFKSNEALTVALARRFGPGTTEENLRSVLVAQGFEPLPPPPSNCLPADQKPPLQQVYTPCYSTKNVLRYQWGGFVCLRIVTVTWRTNERSEVAEIRGSYRSACL